MITTYSGILPLVKSKTAFENDKNFFVETGIGGDNKKMQIEEFFLNNGTKKDYVFMWRALCDEREINEKKAVMVFVLFGNGRTLAESKNQIDGENRCLIDGQSSRELTETFIFLVLEMHLSQTS